MPPTICKFVLPLLLTAACNAQQSLSALYTFQPLQHPNSMYDVPLGINNLRVVAGTFIDYNGISHGYIWKAGAFTQIDYPGVPQLPGGGTTAGGINDRGDVAGVFVDENGFQHGFKMARPPWCLATTTLTAASPSSRRSTSPVPRKRRTSTLS